MENKCKRRIDIKESGKMNTKTKYCNGCLEDFIDSNPEYENYGICTLCAAKVAVCVWAEVVTITLRDRIKKIGV